MEDSKQNEGKEIGFHRERQEINVSSIASIHSDDVCVSVDLNLTLATHNTAKLFRSSLVSNVSMTGRVMHILSKT
jgi:hypothetical protein